MKTSEKYTTYIETEKEIEDHCAYLAFRFQDRADYEASYLYDRVYKWRKKYGNYPTAAKMRSMANQVLVDKVRRESKYRKYSNGDERGNGKYIKGLVSLDIPIRGERGDELDLREAIVDERYAPNEIREYNFDELTNNLDEREKFIIIKFFNGEPKKYIGQKLNICGERVDQILTKSLEKIRDNIGHELR